MRKRAFLLGLSFLLLFGSAYAQERPGSASSSDQSQKQTPPMGSPEEEIIRRAEIRHAEESHKEMVERADEAAQIGDQLLNSFKKNNAFGRDELKKLDRLEKLARKIRGSAGGSDDDEQLENPPDKLEAAVARLAETAGFLKKSVEKTSRLVISAAVIENSNELIELIRHIRSFQKP